MEQKPKITAQVRKCTTNEKASINIIWLSTKDAQKLDEPSDVMVVHEDEGTYVNVIVTTSTGKKIKMFYSEDYKMPEIYNFCERGSNPEGMVAFNATQRKEHKLMLNDSVTIERI